ncbi:MAG: PD40 domain-containing protein [Gammaproteobacteria bacterium]|nr:PD40 domain-containing protein [Gammaproteobacteria bacterium]
MTRTAALSITAVVIAACSRGEGVQLGTGQDPDPVVIDFPIAYIKSPLPLDDNGVFEQQDVREQITFDFGADLYYRDRAAVGAEEINITGEITQGLGAIRDVEIDYDGSRLLFSMRTPFDENVAEEDQVATWNIWQYTFESAELVRVIPSNLTAEAGHDIMPKYLPDGRIIFASTRQRQSQALLLDENKGAFPAMDEDENEYAFNLHVMNDDGGEMRQVTFNQSHDLDPSVMADGKIVFSRWDHNQSNNQINLYRMNPDGSATELLYGQWSHDTGTNDSTIQFLQPRETEDGRVMVVAQPFAGTEGGGELILIDTANYVENSQPTSDNIGVLAGPAQEDGTINDVVTEPGVPSPGGRYYSVYPIQDGTGRLMVSWSQCRLVEILEDDGDPDTDDFRIVACTDENLLNVSTDPDVLPAVGDFTVAPPLYGIWIYDPRDETQQPIVRGEEGFMFTEVVTADSRPFPAVVPDGTMDYTLDPSLPDSGEAILNIRNVYDFDGQMLPGIDPYVLADPARSTAADRPARFLRVEKAVSIPEDDLRDIDDTAFGVTTAFGMKEIVGYAPIEPDGSVMMRVPANAALMISITDENGMRVTQSHQNWIALGEGQELKCNGCHDANSGLSHGRYDAFASAYAGAPAGVTEFPNTDPQWFIGEPGETMAEIRARVTCANDGCSSLEPSMNVIYTDVWSANPLDTNGDPINPDIRYQYADLNTPSPTTLACESDWQWNCRSVINYETIIHPLWGLDRPQFDDAGNPIVDANGVPVDMRCTSCHAFPYIDPADGVTVLPPAGQLELTDGPSIEEPDHFHAYRELLVTDNLQEVDANGVLVDVIEIAQDADGNDIIITFPVAPPASEAGARASSDFFDRFISPNHPGYGIHGGIMSGAELRLVAEWLDVGAQYFNNPFDAPAN